MKRTLIIAVILIALAAAVVFVVKSRQKPEEGAILLSGNVEVTEANLGFKIPGRIVELAVDEGARVTKGQKLASLDNVELASAVAQSRALLAEMRSRHDELKRGTRPQELEQARATLQNAEAELLKAKKDFSRYEALFKEGAVTAQRLDDARKAFDVADAQNKKALEGLSLAKEGPRKEQIQAAADRVTQADAAVKTAEERLGDSVLYASFNGVLLRKNVELGETVTAGMPVFTAGDLEDPWIKVYVKETDLGKVKLGQKARVSTDSYPGKEYEGEVSYISSEAEFTPKNVQTIEERVKLVFGVKVRVRNPNAELKPGMPADVRIVLR